MNQEVFESQQVQHERKQPHEQYVRRGDSPYYFCYAAECWRCGIFFSLSWPRGVEHVSPGDAVMLECPGCRTEFGVMANDLIGNWDHSGLSVGVVRKIQSIVQEEGPAG